MRDWAIKALVIRSAIVGFSPVVVKCEISSSKDIWQCLKIILISTEEVLVVEDDAKQSTATPNPQNKESSGPQCQ